MVKPIADTLSCQLAQVARAHRGCAAEVLAAAQLYPGQEMILQTLWDEDGLSQAELAKRLSVRAPTITKMLARMGPWVVKKPCKEDTRIIRVFLTQKGKKLRPTVESLWALLEAKTLEGLSNSERKQLRLLLAKLLKNLDHEWHVLA